MNKRVTQSAGPMATLPTVISVLEQVTREHGELLNWLQGGFFRLRVYTTANLPAPTAALNGQFVIEDAGGTNRNLVFYENGHSYRVTGGFIA